MNKKLYFLIAGVLLVIIAAVIGIYYWHSQSPKVTVLPETEELSQETENFSQDITDLETIAEDKNLDTLEGDLSAVSEETPLEQKLPSISIIDVNEVENLESELSAELDGISNDLIDLQSFEGDSSLDNLDSSLSGISK